MDRQELQSLFPNASEDFLRRNLAAINNQQRITGSTCKQCGAPKPPRNDKFCSLKCAWDSPERVQHIKPKERGEAICGNCGLVFKLRTHGGVKFCSLLCARSFNGKRTITKNRTVVPRTTFTTHMCEYCGKPFDDWASSNRRFCSVECSSKVAPQRGAKTKHANGWFKSDRPYSRAKRGWHVIGGQRIFCRSRWESNYAKYLEFLKSCGEVASWEHEPDTFWFEKIKRGCRSYLPDFKVVLPSGEIEYHECKGWMDSKSKTKIKRMAKYHPAITLIIRGEEWFRLNKNLRSVVPGWEKG